MRNNLTIITLLGVLGTACSVLVKPDSEADGPTVKHDISYGENTEEDGMQEDTGNQATTTKTAKHRGNQASASMQDVAAGMPQSWETSEETEIAESKAQSVFRQVASAPLSTVSIDVDTASYTLARSMIQSGNLPSPASVRAEEFINYFPYDVPNPAPEDPFTVLIEESSTPWNDASRTAKITLSTKQVEPDPDVGRNFTFLLDVSGSMGATNKLPLLQSAIKTLVEGLDDEDTISIVTYAGSDRVVLSGASGANKSEIRTAVDDLTAGQFVICSGAWSSQVSSVVKEPPSHHNSCSIHCHESLDASSCTEGEHGEQNDLKS